MILVFVCLFVSFFKSSLQKAKVGSLPRPKQVREPAPGGAGPGSAQLSRKASECRPERDPGAVRGAAHPEFPQDSHRPGLVGHSGRNKEVAQPPPAELAPGAHRHAPRGLLRALT